MSDSPNLQKYQHHECLVAFGAGVPGLAWTCRGCGWCAHWRARCERRSLPALVNWLAARPESARNNKIRALRAPRLTDDVTPDNISALLRLLPRLETLDLSRSRGITLDVVEALATHFQNADNFNVGNTKNTKNTENNIVVCLIDAHDVSKLAQLVHATRTYAQWWQDHVVWLGALDFFRYDRHSPAAAISDRCRENHYNWFMRVLQMHYVV